MGSSFSISIFDEKAKKILLKFLTRSNEQHRFSCSFSCYKKKLVIKRLLGLMYRNRELRAKNLYRVAKGEFHFLIRLYSTKAGG